MKRWIDRIRLWFIWRRLSKKSFPTTYKTLSDLNLENSSRDWSSVNRLQIWSEAYRSASKFGYSHEGARAEADKKILELGL